MRAAGFNAQMLRENPNFNRYAYDWSIWWGADTTDPWTDAALWPNSRMQGDAASIMTATRFTTPPRKYGGQQMKKFIGTTRDSAGAVLANAVVQGFLTENDNFIREMTSDAGGYFEFCSQFAATNHYLVAYKAGSPDVAGTTVNTLQPV